MGHYLNKLDRGPLGAAKYQISRALGHLVSDKKIFSHFHNISLNKTCVPQVYKLNKLGRGLLGGATYQVSRLQALWFQTRRFFSHFPYISQCSTCDPQGGAIFGQRAIILTNLVEVH